MEPGHYLDWINILPLVNQVICRPAIWRLRERSHNSDIESFVSAVSVTVLSQGLIHDGNDGWTKAPSSFLGLLQFWLQNAYGAGKLLLFSRIGKWVRVPKRIFYKLIIENEYLLSYLGRIWIAENMKMMREYEYMKDNTYSLLFAEHTLVYLEGTTAGPLGRRGWEKS